MLICWEWLEQYVELTVDADELALRFAMSGLNHEGTEHVGSDTVLDLEVTSNRGDCLGHVGVAREAAVLLGKSLKLPAANPRMGSDSVAKYLAVENEFPDGCPRYTARVIRGVRIGPSPDWLVRRLAAVGIATVNNVVDVTNYVMLECGQPLHAFDLAKIRGGKIIVRAARPQEAFAAIDHRNYELDPEMVVIADSERAVALGGVMGGVDSEVSQQTVDLLIEAACFNPLPIRRAARQLKLHSPSSFRFERRPDPAGLDWASRRCCDLIMQVAGGELLSGVAEAGELPVAPELIEFRLPQLPRVLGIDIPAERTHEILKALGCQVEETSAGVLNVLRPTWRSDLTREVDLIEEVARVFGYDQIPEDVPVPLSIAATRPKDIVLERLRATLSAYSIDEAMTPSVVGKTAEAIAGPWTERPPLATETPLLVGAKLLRRSLLPSLLASRYMNQTQSQHNAELYEVSTIFLPQADASALPVEQSTLGVVTHGDLRTARGIVESVIAEVAGHRVVAQSDAVVWKSINSDFFQAGTCLRIELRGQLLGFVGLASKLLLKSAQLDKPVAMAELSVDALTMALEEVRQADPISAFPSVSRDLNFIVDEAVNWQRLHELCVASGGELLQRVRYQETYRDTQKDGQGKKRLLLNLEYQSLVRTLTSDEVDASVEQIITHCQQELSAKLLG